MENTYVCIRQTCFVFPKLCLTMKEMAQHKCCEFIRYSDFQIEIQKNSNILDELQQFKQVDCTNQQLNTIAEQIFEELKTTFNETVVKMEKFINEIMLDFQDTMKAFTLIAEGNVESLRKHQFKVDDYLTPDKSVKPVLKLIKDKLEQFKDIQYKIGDIFEKFLKRLDKQTILPIKFEWDINKSNNITVDGLEIRPKSGCSMEQYILSKDPIPQNQKSYFEIKRSHTQGCYDSIGLCIKKAKNIRNGQDSNGWALRLHGVNKETTFTGLIHNGQFTKFFEDWENDDLIGVLYDPSTESMSYYRNGKYLGTPFKNVKGELYICVENCHIQGFSKVDEPELPEEVYF